MEKVEVKRQVFHILLGVLALVVLLIYGKGILMGMTFFIIIIGLLLVNETFLGKKIILVDWFRKRFERRNIPFPGWGSACYATGVLRAASFLENPDAIAASVIILAVGDGVSTLIGRNGKIRLPYNRKKTLEGSAAFFVASLPGYFLVGNIIVPIALVAAFVESLDIPFDDNITVPTVTTFLFLVIL